MSKLKILVVDDDEAVLEYLRAKIEARYEVIVTTSSRQVMALGHAPAKD